MPTVPTPPNPHPANTGASSTTAAGSLLTQFKYQLGTLAGTVGAPFKPRPTASSSTSDQGTNAVDKNGMVLTNVQVQLIFWGSAWGGNVSPSNEEVTTAVANIASGEYMTGLAQYRGIGYGSLLGATVVTSSNPPNPFTTDDIAHFILNLIGTKNVPEPDEAKQIWYCVILPPGVNCKQSNVNGEHSYIFNVTYDLPADLDIDMVHYGWVMNDGTLDYVTVIFSHELAESCTNPEGTGFQVTPLDPNSWHEIGDVCEGITGQVDGFAVQAYWSAKDGACIIPGTSTS